MNVDVSYDGPVAILTLDRPERRNAFTMAMRQDIALAFEQLADDGNVRAIILTGAGGHFCSGADTGEMGEPGTVAFLARMRRLHRMIRAIAAIRKPTIAAVDGACVGAGWSLALACDLVIATPDARFAQIFGKIGYAPDAGAIWQLARLIPVMRAKEIVYSARTLDGTEALSLGLVLELVASDALMPRARDLARSLAAGPTLATGMAKAQFGSALSLSLDQFLEQEFLIQPLLATTQDHREGIAAVRDKRPPDFQGC
ncbi:enoyl-CoA hydratase/isomerase family protein [Sphingobium sp. AP49]|uniref:enoyl-CoA hydratase/isomerase family protein n=1 Tax=Sphingobium sp. AP49 TaxID=1144307 RepID=UPI00026ED8F4|nr:enoyl-CoA hydratase/isomerase family protein [Sphingobium sp. AP49]WHO37428.1 enoyl-CoA hydratase/isomerase family protein [Sphingobium sp. AP49]